MKSGSKAEEDRNLFRDKKHLSSTRTVCYDVGDLVKMQDKPVKRKRVKIEFGKRPHPWRFKLLLFVSAAAVILLLFYLFSIAEYTPKQ
jgi:hypothetical protein